MGLLNALYAQQGRYIGKEQLATRPFMSNRIDGGTGRIWDQIMTAYGGLNHIEFLIDGSFKVSPIIVKADLRSRQDQPY